MRDLRRRFIPLFLPALFALALAGCGGPMELAGIHKVAVLTPFNRTDCPTLGEEIKRELLRRLSDRVSAEIVDGAAIEAAFAPEDLAAVLADPDCAAELGVRYGVDALIFGTATYYEQGHEPHFEVRMGTDRGLQANARVDVRVEVGFELKLLRLADGRILVAQHAAESAEETFSIGLDPPSIVLGFSLEPVYPRLREEAVRAAVRRAIEKVARDYRLNR